MKTVFATFALVIVASCVAAYAGRTHATAFDAWAVANACCGAVPIA